MLPHLTMKIAVVAAIAGLGTLCGLSANPVRVTFSGTYTNVQAPGDVVFGISALPAPFAYSITYDTSLNTSPFALLAGTTHNGHVLGDNFIGYSASGIIATSFTFGSKTWTAGALSPRGIDPTTLADFWLNADISSATPTAGWLYLIDLNGSLSLGGAVDLAGTILFHGGSDIDEFGLDFPGFTTTTVTLTRVDLPSTPDAGETAILIAIGLSLLSAANWVHPRRRGTVR